MWSLKKSGRKTWLFRAGRREPGHLVHLTELLETQTTLLTTAELGKLLGLGGVTLRSFLRQAHGRTGLAPVEDPVRKDVVLGHVRAKRSARYYDPSAVAEVLRGRLSEVGDERGGTTPQQTGTGAREAPAKQQELRASVWRNRDLDDMAEHGKALGQWLTTRETADWLGVTTATLHNWRKQLVRTGDRAVYPPFHQGPDLVPSSARDPEIGIAVPRGRRRSCSFRRRHDPVLYDRNQLLLWIKDLQAKRNSV